MKRKTILCVFLMFLAMYLNSKGYRLKMMLNKPEEDINDTERNYDIYKQNPKSLRVVILASIPRSGSTLTGELLTTYTDDAKYIFEPDRYIEKNNCTNEVSCAGPFIKNILSCKDYSFLKWFQYDGFALRYYDHETKECLLNFKKGQNFSQCASVIHCIRDCWENSLQVIKLIRVRLKVFRSILQDSAINVKVIHLYRDPRGSMESTKYFAWDEGPQTYCRNLLSDLIEYEELKKQHPEKITGLSYESLCTKPEEETKKLFKFLFGESDLPSKTQIYIKEHFYANDSARGVMSTIRNSKIQFDKWRWYMTLPRLRKIESVASCKESINRMNLKLFTTLYRIRNESISLFQY